MILKRLVLVGLVAISVVGLSVAIPQKAHATVDGATLQSCNRDRVVLILGNRGACVKVVQQFLNDVYVNYHFPNPWQPDPAWPVLAVDGAYGRQTYLAITAYQRTKNITVDGIVGPQTWNTMFWECLDAGNHGRILPSCY